MTTLDATVQAARETHARIFTRERMLSFVATIDLRSPTEAARELGKTPVQAREDLREIARVVANGDTESLYSKTFHLTSMGQEVYDHCKAALAQIGALAAIGKGNAPVIAFLPHHVRFVARTIKELGGLTKFQAHPLDERFRASEDFERNVVQPLEDGSAGIHLAIGPPPVDRRSRPKLLATKLYTVRLEAMVGLDHAGDWIDLAELVTHDLVVPPPDFRSRKLLEDNIHAHLGTGLKRAHITAFYSAAALVSAGEEGLGTVVLPTDISWGFKKGRPRASHEAEMFKWIPVQHEQAQFTMEVFATFRVADQERIGEAVNILVSKIAQMPDLGIDDPV